MLQHVLFACRQITRRQRFDNFWAIRLFITFKCFSPLPFSIKITGKKKSDLVQFCRIEHSTDQSQCPHRQGSRHYSRCLSKCPAVLHRSRVGKQAGSAAVCHGINLFCISLIRFDQCLNLVHRTAYRLKLVVNHAVRNQWIFNRKHQESKFYQFRTIIPVKFFCSNHHPTAMHIDNDRQFFLCPFPWPVNIQSVLFFSIFYVNNICDFFHFFGERKPLFLFFLLLCKILSLFIKYICQNAQFVTLHSSL